MDEVGIVRALAALAQEHRLGIIQLLVKRGPPGMPAGEIANAICIGPTNASFHLKVLERADLLRSIRHGRYIYYAINADGVRKLLTYLTEQSCHRRSEPGRDSLGEPKLRRIKGAKVR